MLLSASSQLRICVPCICVSTNVSNYTFYFLLLCFVKDKFSTSATGTLRHLGQCRCGLQIYLMVKRYKVILDLMCLSFHIRKLELNAILIQL